MKYRSLYRNPFFYTFLVMLGFSNLCLAEETSSTSGSVVLSDYLKVCTDDNFSEPIQELCFNTILHVSMVAGGIILIISLLVFFRVKPFKLTDFIKIQVASNDE